MELQRQGMEKKYQLKSHELLIRKLEQQEKQEQQRVMSDHLMQIQRMINVLLQKAFDK